MLEPKIPEGPLDQKWTNYRSHARLVNPANRKKLHVIVVGTGLAGSSVAASLGEAGYQVTSFCFRYAQAGALRGRTGRGKCLQEL